MLFFPAIWYYWHGDRKGIWYNKTLQYISDQLCHDYNNAPSHHDPVETRCRPRSLDSNVTAQVNYALTMTTTIYSNHRCLCATINCIKQAMQFEINSSMDVWNAVVFLKHATEPSWYPANSVNALKALSNKNPLVWLQTFNSASVTAFCDCSSWKLTY